VPAIPSSRPLALVAALAIVLATLAVGLTAAPAAGTWTVTLTVTDGWGKAASTTRQVTVTAT
jgi:hypothetical protein